MKLVDAVEKRHSVRSFKTKKVRWYDVLEAVDAAAKAPFAGNSNHLKFIIIEDKKKISKISEHCQQDWISEAKIVVVACGDYKNLDKLYDDLSEDYGKYQTGAAVQNFLLRITDLGLASCWVSSFSEEMVKKLLKIPKDIKVEAILPVGYEFEKSTKKKKVELENLLYWEEWDKDKRPTLTQDPETR